jgi:hypothetical protein
MLHLQEIADCFSMMYRDTKSSAKDFFERRTVRITGSEGWVKTTSFFWAKRATTSGSGSSVCYPTIRQLGICVAYRYSREPIGIVINIKHVHCKFTIQFLASCEEFVVFGLIQRERLPLKRDFRVSVVGPALKE